MSEYIYEHSRCHDHFGKPLDAPLLTQREEIVRCRDCEWFDPFLGDLCMRPDGNGDYMRFEVESDGFCKWGEKRDV